MLNVESALAHLNSNASEKSHGNCAKFVRLAIKAGGVNIISPPLRPNYDYPAAADYGASLLAKGFTIVFTHNTGGSELTDTTTIPGQQAGDVVVIQDIPGHRYGHMAMFNGTQWVSDFRQPMGFYPARAYSSLKSAFKMYRYGETEKNTPSDQSNADNKDLHICYPITKNPKGNEFGNAEEILAHLRGEPAGFYLVGRNGMWHGGIHISSVTTPWSALSGKGTSESVDFPVPYKGEQPLRCMADGEIVAYRVCKNYLEAPWTSGSLSYSGSFVLIRHYLQPGDDKKSSLTFYTLYMHLAPWSTYQAGKGEKIWKVNERKGLSAYEDADRTVRKGTLPNGTKVRWDEMDEGFKTQTDKGRIYGNVTLAEDVIVKARGNIPEKKQFSQGDQVWILADRANLKTTEPVVIPPAWWAHFQPPTEEKLVFEQVTCPVPFRINAKDPVGHLGYYQNPVAMGYVPRYQSHIECFSIDENLPTFLTNPEKLEQEDRPLFLKYTPGLPRYNKNLSTGKFVKEAEATRSTGIATLKKVKSINEQAAGDKSAETYFQIYPETAWLAKKDVKLLSRYDLAELGFTLTEDSPTNFDKLDGKTPPETLIRKILDILHNAAKQETRVDYALIPQNYQRLIDMISTNSDGYYSPDEYRQAIHNPVLRDTLFRIIAKHPSEWFYKPTDSLWISYLEKLTQDAPEWKKYNESVIEKLVWMQDVDKNKVLLRSALYHMHPITFLDNFKNTDCARLIWGKIVDQVHGQEKGCEFRKKVVKICCELWGELQKNEYADVLMASIAVETSRKFMSTVADFRKVLDSKGDVVYVQGKNGPRPKIEQHVYTKDEISADPTITEKNAVGLIQFTAPAVRQINKINGLQITKQQLALMDELEQLDYVKLYFSSNDSILKKVKEPKDIYLFIFCPEGVGQNDDYVLYSRQKDEDEGVNYYLANSSLDSDQNGNIGNNDLKIQRRELLSRLNKLIEEGGGYRNICICQGDINTTLDIALEPSGRQWVNRYPTSVSLTDLEVPFRESVNNFVLAIKTGGGGVSVSATYRPVERAYLMHYSWMIARESLAPAQVPPMNGVNIDWQHKGDNSAAVAAAEEMVAGYQIVYRPVLTSRHTQRRAIDMTITGVIGKTIVTKLNIETPIKNNSDLYSVGASYGVIKLISDPPHWSDDGR
ncbi:hypothetical protein Rahaq_4572 (plasmid) [Rahnella aceris]|jgi:hypothetical protein|uniref:Uncharacterized protein n=1 Tax=Rahnella sp. (strain Y9602) TaxID=2703885 RepID=A0A0H3FMA2_RAHSY|nr:hypothetical protein [Rahnella aceris]ADW76153.1 hypothetical protein Rahaq_4572 [Rahnella aceris]AFE60834.1 hypothetical protein Q7S_23381 [Rahnella aquatilis HX2]MBU9859078.1 hypothetical protein [Rahnella aceris]